MRALFFGGFQVFDDQGSPLEVGSPTARSLFAWLLLHRHQPADRRRLAFLFWPNASENAARRNLRQYLHRLRTGLLPLFPAGGLLEIGSSSLQLDPSLPVWLDVEAFTQGLRPGASLAEQQAALALYTGDFLPDFYDEWAQTENERLRALYLSGLEKTIRALQAAADVQAALPLAQAWVRAEPLDENAHRCLLRLYALNGERGRALQHYQALRQTLQQELGADPLPETQGLWQTIQRGEMRPPPPALTAPSRPLLRPAATLSLPIIGRETELQRLQAALEAQNGGIFLISGDAGIGKTRLVQEYLTRNPGLPVLQGACSELESLIPFAALRRALENAPALRSRLGLQPLPPVQAALLGLLAPSLAESLPQAAPIQPPENLPEAWNNLLQGLVSLWPGLPLHLVLDDLHWADSSTWAWLTAFARLQPQPRLLVFVLCRLEELPAEQRSLLRSLEYENRLQSLPLSPLQPQQAASLMRRLLPERADDLSLLERLTQDTAGNPFFIIETAHALRESGMKLTPSPLPPSVQRVLESRLQRLSAASREALQAASVFGQPFSLALMQEVCGLTAANAIAFLEEGLERGLLEETPNGEYDFRHDQVRQVAYTSLSQARRQWLHGRVGESLQNSLPPVDSSTLTYHFSRSEQPLKALPFLIQAGQQALRLRSYVEARAFGLQAVSLLGRMPGPRQSVERVDINLQLAQAYAFTGDLPRAIQILEETTEMAQTLADEARLGQVFRRAAQFFWLLGRPSLAGDYARRALRLAEELQSADLLLASLRMLGRVSIALAAFDDAIAYLMRFANLQEAASPLPAPELPVVLGYLGVAYARVGALERAFASAQRGLNLAKQATPASGGGMETFARMQQAMTQASLRQWEECIESLAPLKEVPAPEEWTPALYMAFSLRGYARAQTGQPALGLADLRAAIAWAERRGYRVFAYLPRLFLAEALTLAGQPQEAYEQASLGLEQARESGNRWAEAFAQRLLADAAAHLPSPDWRRVESSLLASMQIFRQIRARPDLAWTYLALRRLYDRAGQIAWAVDCHFRATTIFDELGMNEALRDAQGRPGGEHRPGAVLSNLPLQGPNAAENPDLKQRE